MQPVLDGPESFKGLIQGLEPNPLSFRVVVTHLVEVAVPAGRRQIVSGKLHMKLAVSDLRRIEAALTFGKALLFQAVEFGFVAVSRAYPTARCASEYSDRA